MSAATDVMAELALLEDPKLRAANEERGDDHGVNLSAMRAVAKRLKTQHELAEELWATGDTAARLLATLIGAPCLPSPKRPAPRRQSCCQWTSTTGMSARCSTLVAVEPMTTFESAVIPRVPM